MKLKKLAILFLQYSIFSFTNSCYLICYENLNISENNRIGVEAAKVVGYTTQLQN
jgi:hypothetical protein